MTLHIYSVYYRWIVYQQSHTVEKRQGSEYRPTPPCFISDLRPLAVTDRVHYNINETYYPCTSLQFTVCTSSSWGLCQPRGGGFDMKPKPSVTHSMAAAVKCWHQWPASYQPPRSWRVYIGFWTTGSQERRRKILQGFCSKCVSVCVCMCACVYCKCWKRKNTV